MTKVFKCSPLLAVGSCSFSLGVHCIALVKLMKTPKLNLCGLLEKMKRLEETQSLCGFLTNEDIDNLGLDGLNVSFD